MQCFIMLSAAYSCCNAERDHAEYCYAECPYAGCRFAECRGVRLHSR